MIYSLLLCSLLAADPTPEQTGLLTTFRNEFVVLTPGTDKYPAKFTMGSDAIPAASPAHEVTLAGKFAIAKYEVPQNLWQAVMGSNPSRWKGPRNSVEVLTYDDAVQFCEKATALMRAAKLIEPNEQIRLPSEAEWEYAARAGTTTAYSFGDGVDDLGKYGWFTGNAAGNDPPVGAKAANPWGLYDMHGYLWEWTSDVWHDDYRGAPTTGAAWSTGGDDSKRVLRSGSWKDKADSLQTAARRGGAKDLRDDAVGLRCVLSR